VHDGLVQFEKVPERRALLHRNRDRRSVRERYISGKQWQ